MKFVPFCNLKPIKLTRYERYLSSHSYNKENISVFFLEHSLTFWTKTKFQCGSLHFHKKYLGYGEGYGLYGSVDDFVRFRYVKNRFYHIWWNKPISSGLSNFFYKLHSQRLWFMLYFFYTLYLPRYDYPPLSATVQVRY